MLGLVAVGGAALVAGFLENCTRFGATDDRPWQIFVGPGRRPLTGDWIVHWFDRNPETETPGHYALYIANDPLNGGTRWRGPNLSAGMRWALTEMKVDGQRPIFFLWDETDHAARTITVHSRMLWEPTAR